MTDMFHHSKLVQSLDSLIAAGPGVTGVPLLNSFNAAGRAIVLQMVVHAADISNTCRPPELCGKWAKRVTDGTHHSSIALFYIYSGQGGLLKS